MGLFNIFSKKKDSPEIVIKKRTANFLNFKEVTDYLYLKSGITDLDTRKIASTNIQSYALSKGFYTSNEILDGLKSDNNFYQEVINIATVNETFFMRELKELEWLVKYIKEENRPLKILSMPSSSGEETYSILIMLSEVGFDLNKLEITGYDINSQAVALAKKGEYIEHSLHKLGNNTRQKYFTQNNTSYKISSILREKARFMQQNIFELEGQSNKYDIILSRNMFIYFDDEKRSLALDIIVSLLKQKGIYIKGHADHIKKHERLTNINYGVYQKLN